LTVSAVRMHTAALQQPAGRPGERLARLAGRLARPVWLLAAGLAVLAFLANIPLRVNQARTSLGLTLEYGSRDRPVVEWLNPNGPAARAGMEIGDALIWINGAALDLQGHLSRLQPGQPVTVLVRSARGIPRQLKLLPGLSWDSVLYAQASVLVGAVYVILGALIYWRRPRDRMAWIISLGLVTFGASSQTLEAGWLALPARLSYFVFGLPLAFLTLVTFPDGRLLPRWGRWVALGGTLLSLAYLLPEPYYAGAWPGGLDAAVLALFFLSGLGIQAYRFRQVSSVLERQQTRWVVIGLAAGITADLLFERLLASPLLFELVAVRHWYLYVALYLLTQACLVLIPLTLAISILRYRLWDIGLVINRAMVYSALTAGLGLVGVISLNVFDYMLHELTSSQSPLLVILLSMLPLAAVFKPLQTHLQKWVDHYFKPDEIDLGSGFVEFAPEVHTLLKTDDLVRVLVLQVQRQLNTAAAAVYLLDEDGAFTLVDAPAEGALLLSRRQAPERGRYPARLAPDAAQFARLDGGRLVELAAPALRQPVNDLPVPGGEPLSSGAEPAPGGAEPPAAPWVIWAPLTVLRARQPDVIGVLALGPRLDGTGYSSQVMQGLASLGAQAGRAIYVAQLRQHSRRRSRARRFTPAS
ncbi:MAG: hypothetical protein ACKOC5_06365, partial [Chloroflexota bacterium]